MTTRIPVVTSRRRNANAGAQALICGGDCGRERRNLDVKNGAARFCEGSCTKILVCAFARRGNGRARPVPAAARLGTFGV